MTGKRKRIVRLIILAVFLIMLAAGVALINDTAERKAERFVKRCAPDWDPAFEALVVAGGQAERGEAMSEPLQKIFGKDRSLNSISMVGEETADFRFDWHSDAEKQKYVFFQENDDCWKNNDVATVMSWRDIYNEDFVSEENEKGLKVTGIGMGKRGYITITRIRPCWFYVETYFPT